MFITFSYFNINLIHKAITMRYQCSK